MALKEINTVELPIDSRRQAHRRLATLVECRHAPTELYPGQRVWWPRDPLEARALPGGIESDLLDKLIALFRHYGNAEVLLGDLGASEPLLKYLSHYSAELCHWIKTELLSNPTCILSTNHDLLLIADDQLRYSVLGASVEIIERFEASCGGADRLKEVFSKYVDEFEVGFGAPDREWATSHLMRWSGWT